jgi:RNA polymerase sigma-70 factor (ECF subfamily)
VLDRNPRVDQQLLAEHRAREIREAIEALPPKQLAAVLMHKYEGLDYVQIAEVLDCSIPALKSLLFRAYEALRRRLAHFAPERVA